MATHLPRFRRAHVVACALVAAAAAATALHPPPACAQAVDDLSCFTPREWQPKLGSRWNRDVDGNFVEDDIDAMPPTDVVDLIVALNTCPTRADSARLAAYGTVVYRGRYLSILGLRSVHVADAIALAADPIVAEVTLDHSTGVHLSTSNRAIKVRPSPTYSPNTVLDSDPAITGTGVTIAILDTGVDDGMHESLPGSKFVGGYNVFTAMETNPDDEIGDPGGHGTHVAGIALGTGGPSGAYRGIAPDAKLVDIKTFSSFGNGSELGIIDAIEKCIERRVDWQIDVVNMSGGSNTKTNGLDAVSQAANRAVQAGIVFVASVGNCKDGNGSIGANLISPPSAADRAIAVAASIDQGTVDRSDDAFSTKSNYGPRPDDGDGDATEEQKPDVNAPGTTDTLLCLATPGTGGILSAQFDTANGYWLKGGTSMASPHVAGLAALAVQTAPGILPQSVKKLINDTAEDKGPVGWDPEWGHGLIDAYAAVHQLETTPKTDLRFTVACGAPGPPDWWLSPDLVPGDPIIEDGVPNTIKATVTNPIGGAVASGFLVRLGVFNFSNSQLDYDVCSFPVDQLDPGNSITVTCDWTPVVTPSSNGTIHACLKAEIVYAFDADYSNNCAQHNINIQTESGGMAAAHAGGAGTTFRALVVNPTDDDLTIRFDDDLPPASGWTLAIDQPTFALGGFECPRTVGFTLTPGPTAVPAVLVSIAVIGRGAAGEIPLGGFGLAAQRRSIRDCNHDSVDDSLDILIGASKDADHDGVPDDCEPTAAPLPARARDRFIVEVAPNPFARGTLVRWPAGGAAAHVEVLDLHGRIVRRTSHDGTGASGAWTWGGEDDQGHPVEPGVYTVRVTRADGRQASQHIVLIR